VIHNFRVRHASLRISSSRDPRLCRSAGGGGAIGHCLRQLCPYFGRARRAREGRWKVRSAVVWAQVRAMGPTGLQREIAARCA
jgi:hypothetical protein